MSTFNETDWADPAYSAAYLESADHFIPDRRELFRVLRSFHQHFVIGADDARVCDLGCGDGAITEQLLQVPGECQFTLVDGAAGMLDAARQRIGTPSNCTFVQRSFQELIEDHGSLPRFTMVASAFAIHHLEQDERARLFETVRDLLHPGGFLLNIDVGLATRPELTSWYVDLWREWIAGHRQAVKLDEDHGGIPDQAFANPDNKYRPLSEQLEALSAAGFQEVDCHYKNSLFTIYSGRKRPE